MCHSWSDNCILACRLPPKGMGRIYIFMFAWVKMSNFNHRAKEIMMKCFEPNWSFSSCESCAHTVILEHLSSSVLSLPPSCPDKWIHFFPAHTSDGQSESKRQGEEERDRGWKQVTTIHPADCLPNPSSNSWRTNASEISSLSLFLSFSLLSDTSHRLHVSHLSLLFTFIIIDDITGLWNIYSTQRVCHSDILDLRHYGTGVFYSK